MKKLVCAFACLLLLYVTDAFAQSGVKGTVRDEKGPLAGVTVQVKHTSRGATTNASGNFSIQTIEGDTLVITSSGYIAQEIAVDDRAAYNVMLVTDVQSMENVVVIGYGTKKKENLTGAVSTITSQVLQSRPITNTIAGIQGEIPGLTIQRSSGQPGLEEYDLNVRGVSSTNGGNSPLILIDGISGSLDLLNPDDIESISVLKDASASIYGARAAGGVMLVTTKRGKKGRPLITYNGNVAITKMSGMMESPNTYQFAIMENEANIHNGAAPMYTPDLLEKIKNNDPNPIPHPLYGGWMLFFTTTDWVKAVIENGYQQKHNLNISGGGNNSTYYLSGGYSKQYGVIRYAPDNNERYNLRLSYDYDFSKRLRLETKVSFEDQKRTDAGGIRSSGIITEAIFGMPNHPVYTKSGEKFFAQGGWGNALAQAKESATANFDTRNINTNFKLIIDILKGLKLNLQAGIDHTSQDNTDIGKAVPLYKWDESDIAYYTIARPATAWLTKSSSENTYRNFTGYFQYNTRVANKHEIDIMGGASHEENEYDWFSATRDHFLTDLFSLNLGGTQNMSNDGGGNQWSLTSMFSRLSYIYNSKYMLEANLRYDGSSRFSPDTRWGFFPGISIGWRLSQEDFIKNLGLFNDLKLRASYGETGNQEGVRLYDYYQLINIGSRSYPYPFGAGSQTQSASLDTLAAKDRTWETLVNRNVGIDATLLSNKLNFSFDYFNKRNKDMLIPVTYPSVLGAPAPFSNSGELKTWGFETSIGWNDRIRNVKYSVKLILSDAQNKMVNYGGRDTYVQGLNTLKYWWDPNTRKGDPLDSYYGYVFDGVIRSQKQLDDYKLLGGVPSDIKIGDAMFKDLNGDGKISLYGDKPGENGDVINLGSLTPRYTFGININVSFRNFDLGIFAQGVAKRTIFRDGDYSMPWSAWWRQPPLFYYGKTWNEDRPDAPYPELSFGSINYWNYQASTLQKINAAYIRLKNLQVGYTFPVNLMKKLTITKARIYFSGQDIWELQHVKGGWDPEASTSGFNYPFQRLYSFGIDVTF
jgi:TonB-linked SusC/RagA family outer membrane protein